MKNEHQYLLEKGSKKYDCPNCHKKTFVLYIDTETGDYMPQQYGRCDRESKCAYHLNPYSEGYVKTLREQQKVTGATQGTAIKQKHFYTQPPIISEPVYFDFETFKETLQPERYEKNLFIQNLFYRVKFPFKADEVTKVIELYRLGTVVSGYRAGAVTFPFIDIGGNIRVVQVKQFDKTNHTTGTDFLHSIIEKHYKRNNQNLPQWLTAYNGNDKKVSCLFGEHLLSKYPLNPVALVEAPKTAVYGALYFGLPESPENLIWLAVYNKSSFTPDKLKVLQGRNVFTFPDLSENGSTFKEWETKAKKIENKLSGTRFIFSELLEQSATATDKNKGFDLADYLIRQDWRLFRKQLTEEKENEKTENEYQNKIQDQSEIQNKPQNQPECFLSESKTEPEKIITCKENTDHKVEHTKRAEPAKPLEKTDESVNTNRRRAEKKGKKYPELWSKEISELENFFAETEFSTTSIQLNPCSTISEVQRFIKSHLSVIKANNGNSTYFPYLSRLQELKNRITEIQY